MSPPRTPSTAGAQGRVASWLAGWARRIDARRRARLHAQSLVEFVGA